MEPTEQDRRLDAIARFAATVAHDLNNQFTAILGFSESLRRQLEGHPSATTLTRLREAADRASECTRRLQALGRQAVPLLRRIDLNQLARGVQPLLSGLLAPDQHLVLNLAPEPLPCQIDRTQIEQALIALMRNASESFRGPGIIRLSTHHDGDQVVLTLTDPGRGMTPDELDRVCEPLVSTKADRQAGWGLPLACRAIRQAGGHFTLTSQPTVGTSAHLFFARAVDPAPAQADGALVGFRILVAEDDPSQRELICAMLRQEGCVVSDAGDGTEAERLARQALEIDALVTDVVMPGYRGPELAARLRSAHPRLRVVAISGSITSDADEVQVPGMVFLAKPITRARLVEALAGLFKI